MPNAILNSLHDKKHLGVHTDLLGDGLLELMDRGVVDNSRKTINRENYRFAHGIKSEL